MEKHPREREIEEYVLGKLDEKKDTLSGNHIARCEKCLRKVRVYSKLEILWENWNLENCHNSFKNKKQCPEKFIKRLINKIKKMV